jgi:hypothetical protein
MSLPSIIIGILLSAVALGIGATFWGDTFNEGAAAANASELLKQSEEIKESLALYRVKNKGTFPTMEDGSGNTVIDLQVLVDQDYLKQIPEQWQASGQVSLTETDSEKVNDMTCLYVNRNAGYESETVPSCSALPSALTGSSFYCCDDV